MDALGRDPERGRLDFGACVSSEYWTEARPAPPGARRGEGFLCNCTPAEFAWIHAKRYSWRKNFKSLRQAEGTTRFRPVFGRRTKQNANTKRIQKIRKG